MNKKISFIIICLFFYSCGFQPLLKDYNNTRLSYKKINYYGKNDLVYLLKNNLNIDEKEDSDGLIANLTISQTLSTTNKNIYGIPTQEDLFINLQVNILDKNEKSIYSDNFSIKKNLTITSNLATDQEIRNTEKNHLIKSISENIKYKLARIVAEKM